MSGACGAKLYELTGSVGANDWINLDGESIVVRTLDATNIGGPYPLYLEVSLVDWPALKPVVGL